MRLTPKTRLVLIKSVHTLIWAFFVFMIAFVLWSGITGKISVYSWVAVCTVCLEGLTLLLFKGKCPLTLQARKYSSSAKDNFDIYLPLWLAKYNKLIFTTLFVIGLLLMLFRV